jgi:hypothetical protein
MDKRAWYKNKKRFFYVLVLFQTGVIIFTAAYVVLFVNNTRNGKSALQKNGYRRYYNLKSESKGKTRGVKGLKAFNIFVRAKGRIDIDDDQRRDIKNIEPTAPIGKRKYNESDVKKYNNNSDHNNLQDNDKDEYKMNKTYKNKMGRKSTKKKKNNKRYSSKKRTSINTINRKDFNGNRQKRNTTNKKRKKKINGNKSNTNSKKPKGNNDFLSELSQPNQVKPILMFIAIMSAPERIRRRNALRRSWLRQCEQHNTSCYFFTDALDTHGDRLPDEISVALEQEQFLHKDMILTGSPGGINFSRRYLWIINWANRNYKFDFLLRVDDDYFICMDRLFLELPYRKTVRNLYWGHVHCFPPGKLI